MTFNEFADVIGRRYETTRGVLSVEDLWELPLQTQRRDGASLDQIAIDLDRRLRTEGVVSFVEDQPKANEGLQLAFDVVKHIIDVRKAENAAVLVERERAATKQRILEIIAKKQDSELEGKTIDELKEQLAAL